MNKKILITGSTGLIGRRLAAKLCEDGAYVRALTRDASKARAVFPRHYAYEALDAAKIDSPAELAEFISDTDIVVNLAGANIGAKRWNNKYKDLIMSSRVETTELLVNAISVSKGKPECLISASGTGFYGDQGDEIVTEETNAGSDFLARVCKSWENEAMKAAQFGVRVVTVRTGVVLDRKEGALPKLVQPFRFFIGAYQGSGRQWMSWIHIEDIVALYYSASINSTLSGPLNGCSPEPVRNRDLIKSIGNALGRNLVMPVPGFILKLAAGEFAENLLTGQRAIPTKALNAGFQFRFPGLNEALADLLKG